MVDIFIIIKVKCLCKRLSIFFLILNCVACTYESINDDSTKIVLNEKTLENPEPLPLSTISNESRYMVIDTTGGNYISNIQIFCGAGEDYLIVDDRNWVFIVKPDGKVKSKFNHIGKGPGEYLEIATLTVDPTTQNIYVRCRQLNKLIKYNVEGDLLSEIQIEGYYIDHLTFEGSNLVGLSSFPSFLTNVRSPEFVFIFDQNLKIIQTQIHPIWVEFKRKYTLNPLMGIKSSKIEEGLVFYEMYQNGQFFIIDTEDDWNVHKWMEIQLENQLSDNQVMEAHGYLSNPGIFDGSNYIDDVVITPNYLFLGVVNKSIFNNFKSVLYDIKNNTFSTVYDFAEYPRLWDDVNGFFSFWPMGYLPSTNELYFIQNPGKMMQEYNEAIEISPGSFMETDPEIVRLFEKAKSIGNPVIQLVKLSK